MNKHKRDPCQPERARLYWNRQQLEQNITSLVAGQTLSNWEVVLDGLPTFNFPLNFAFQLVGRFAGISGTTFITLPTGFGSTFQVTGGPDFGNYGTFGANSQVNFGSAIEQFRINGINPSVDAALANAFPLQVFFSSATGSFTQSPLSSGSAATQFGY